MKPLRLATRASALALAQSGQVARALERALRAPVELVEITTKGDREPGALAALGGKGLFVKELEEALLDGRAELAVHSAKDLPARLAEGTALAAVPERADARDALLTLPRGGSLAALPDGARVGTGSLRRRAQLLAARPDLVVLPLRGNVDTRIRKLEKPAPTDRDGGALDAVVLACAGLERLGLAARIDERLAPALLLPAVGQGCLALQTRADDPVAKQVSVLDHAPTRAALEAERAFLVALAGDCNVPLAAHAQVRGGAVVLDALLAAPDGTRILRASASAPCERAADAGRRAAADVLAQGGDAILRALGAPA